MDDSLSPLSDADGLPEWPTLQNEDEHAEALQSLREEPRCEKGEGCVLYDPMGRAVQVAAQVVQAVMLLTNAAIAMWAHGDDLAAEQVIRGCGCLLDEYVRPYLIGAGLITENGEDLLPPEEEDDEYGDGGYW